MGAARDALRQGRRDLHREMSVPALYLVTPDATPHPCTVRYHDKPLAAGHLQGASIQGYAQVQEVSENLIFLVDDAPAKIRQSAIVSIAAGEAYRIQETDPPHDITITAKVARLSAAEAQGLPVP